MCKNLLIQIVVMNDEEISKNEKEILRHFENLKAGLLKV
jgi:hypothetical protein